MQTHKAYKGTNEPPMTAAQMVRVRYRGRVEKSLQPLQLAAMLMTRAEGGAHNINLVAIDAGTLLRIGRAIAGLALKQCNYGLTDRDEKRWENLKRDASAIASTYNLTITAHGDPRGFVLRLHGDDIYRNGWGDGFGVA